MPSNQIKAQDYPSTFGYSLLIGSKNQDEISIDPIEQHTFSSFGVGLFWDCYPEERFSFLTEFELIRRDGKESNIKGSINQLNLYYLQSGVSAKFSYKNKPIFKPYLLVGAYAMGLLFRNDRSIKEGYLKSAVELRLGIGITHIFFSRKFALESTYRNAYLTFEDGNVEQGAEGYFVTFRYYWSKNTLADLDL